MNALLKANRHILSMLKERLNQLEAVESAPVDTEKVPSKGQAFFYRSKAVLEGTFPSNRNPSRSIVRIEQDSSFIVTDFFLLGVYVQDDFGEGMAAPTSFFADAFIKLTNTSSGRSLSIATGENLVPNATSEIPSFGIPFPALTPAYSIRLGGGFAPFGLDYNYKFPVEYQLPRGATVEAMVQWAAGTPNYRVGLDYVLGGYKVFGA